MKVTSANILAVLAVLVFASLPLNAEEVVTYYHNDQLGSPLAATDSSGAVVWQQAYDPWGEPVTTTANNRAFTGKWRDQGTGLNDYSARWQSSSIGRFTQIDDAPWNESNIHSFNRYAYANNSPYRYKDPDGNVPVDTIWDLANVIYDGGRIIYGKATGNDQIVAEANTDMTLDLVAMATPYIPAGASKVARMVAKASNAKTVAKAGRSAGAMARREYRAASYHGKAGNAVKSKAPKNGQDALDMSVQVKGTSPRRVGIDYETGEFAVFDQTTNGVFHGHVRGWNDLTSQMQNALRKAGMVDRKGKILRGGQ
ncbi:RHS repeat-associated core domain-containing protein [Marinobacter oulmenensis]|uniref:RHS repeat-associated protein n=1 Tax=Marinobacter oulmenensis TaxID=643747 RepID=A0A840UK07_9GAMM|nr:RHS repeat-associated core domain-containing protein [Marinobacter oulmenensis]MBB5321167.1 RHS repeat-associated protein [Marinobacter oulmenensis]